MHAVADVLAELTDLRILPELPELTETEWSGLVAEWMTAEPETEPGEEETVTEPAPEDYSYRSRGC